MSYVNIIHRIIMLVTNLWFTVHQSLNVFFTQRVVMHLSIRYVRATRKLTFNGRFIERTSKFYCMVYT